MTREIPLFPLGTVLFPSMPISLHIFEERYKTMMNRCITENIPFGVVLIEKGQEVGNTSAQPHPIGCMANIAQVHPLRDGRMNMVAIGQERFKIVSLNHDKPYMTGMVEEIELAMDREEITPGISSKLHRLLLRYLDILSNVGKVEFNVDKLPSEPDELAYLASTLLQAPNNQKQKLLEINQLSLLMSTVYDTYRREISILRMMLESDTVPDNDTPFSLN